MSVQRRDFLLLVALAAAIASPAEGQTVALSPTLAVADVDKACSACHDDYRTKRRG